eukprot:s1230_g24.t1
MSSQPAVGRLRRLGSGGKVHRSLASLAAASFCGLARERCFELAGILLLGLKHTRLNLASADVQLISAGLSPRWPGHGIESPQPCLRLETRPGRLGSPLSPTRLSECVVRSVSPSCPDLRAPAAWTHFRHLPPPDLDVSVLREGANPSEGVLSWPAGPRPASGCH